VTGWRALRVLSRAAAAAVCLALSVGAASAVSAASKVNAPTNAAALGIRKEILVLEAQKNNQVLVFQELALSRPPKHAWQVPLPYEANGVAPATGTPRVTVSKRGVVTAPAGVSTVSVVYHLSGRLGSVFVQNLSLRLGEVAVLAGPGVYPGVGTGLQLHGQTRISGKTFTLFNGGAQGPGGVVHFSLTVGNQGAPWADGVGIFLLFWLAAGAYLCSRRVMAVLRTPLDKDAA
jgi:hypothetical protein